ncbi:hypothetical protein BJ165DRAFT_1611211 [Panaeolus papilionaceus]|nr:hypothetical protein BJ165DRAFT_1611211 [Panaeolus papilionaceus]
MVDTTYNYAMEMASNNNHGQRAGDPTDRQWLSHPYEFALSSQLPGYDGSDSGTPEQDYFVQVNHDQRACSWTRPVQTEGIVVEHPTTRAIDAEEFSDHQPLYETISATTCLEHLYHPQRMCVDTPPPPIVISGSSPLMNSLHSTGSGTPTELRDASCYSDASWIVPTVGTTSQQLEPQGPTIQNENATSYYAAHRPIPPQQQSRYSSLLTHVAFMIHVESQKYPPRKIPPPAPTPPSRLCISAVEMPLTLRHRKPVGESSPVPSREPPPPLSASIGSASHINNAVPRAMNGNHSYAQPPVQEPPYQQFTMMSTKAVRGRHLLPALPAPAAVTISKPSAVSTFSPAASANLSTTSAPEVVSSTIPMKREATEQHEDDIIRSRPVSRRGSAVSASECNSSPSNTRDTSAGSIIIPPPSRRGSGTGSSSTLPRGTSAAAVAAAAAVNDVTGAQNPHLVYPHPPAVFDFSMGSSKGGASSSSEMGVKAAVGGGALMSSAPRNVKEPRRPSLACTFCRERKIACGRPPSDSEDQTCNQCERRGFTCEYTNDPKRKRGEGKGTRKKRGGSAGSTDSSTPSTPSTA